jgi:hypothetical protein
MAAIQPSRAAAAILEIGVGPSALSFFWNQHVKISLRTKFHQDRMIIG